MIMTTQPTLLSWDHASHCPSLLPRSPERGAHPAAVRPGAEADGRQTWPGASPLMKARAGGVSPDGVQVTSGIQFPTSDLCLAHLGELDDAGKETARRVWPAHSLCALLLGANQ